jgi:hypothetical protein
MAIQTVYSTDFALAVAGQLFDDQLGTRIASRVVAAGANIPAGAFVVKSTTDTLAKLPASAADLDRPEGVVLYDASRRPGAFGSTLPNGASLAEGCSVLSHGIVWVTAESNVAKGDPVFARHTPNGAGKLTLGALRNDGDAAAGVDTARQVPARWYTTATAGNLAAVELNLP